ncbi:MAG: response regulator [Candidatus Kerfeldbacteria bacterium]
MTNLKGKIVIIEDEVILIDVLSKKLENEGYEVQSAEDGLQGLEVIESFNPDLVLLDIAMPKMNGYEVLASLNEKFGLNNMPPVIIISNSGQPVEIDKARDLGAKDFIIKAQFTPAEVLEKVNKVLGMTKSLNDDIDKKTLGIVEENSSASSGKDPEARILVVEDDQFLRDLLKTKLEKENFEVSTAIDGPGGIEKIGTVLPDIMLLDIILPGMDGFEVLKRVRTNSNVQVAGTPIILLSNLGQEADIEKGRALGADDYLIKSNFTIDEIIEKLRSLLAAKK